MRKILFIIPFFLWTCGGGSKSSPTESVDPPDQGNDALFTVFTNVFWDGQSINFQWLKTLIDGNLDPDHAYYSIQIFDETTNTWNQIWQSADTNTLSYNYPMQIGNEAKFNLITHNSNGTSQSSNGHGFPPNIQSIFEFEKSFTSISGGVRAFEFGYDGYIIGAFQNYNSNTYTLNKIDGNGNIQQTFDLNTNIPHAFHPDYSNNGYIVGSYASIIRIDQTGILWKKSGDEITNGHDGSMRIIYDIMSLSDNSYIYCGEIGSSHGSFGVGKLDNDGTPVWFKNYGVSSSGVGGGTPRAFSLGQIDNNSFIAVGDVLKYEGGNNIKKGYIVIFDSNGDINYEKWFDNIEHFESVKILSNGTIMAVGSGNIVIFDSALNIINEINNYDGTKIGNDIEFTDIENLLSGNILITGLAYDNSWRNSGNHRGHKDVFLLYLDSNGNIINEFFLYKNGGFESNLNFGSVNRPLLVIKDPNGNKDPFLLTQRDLNGTSTGEIFLYKLHDIY